MSKLRFMYLINLLLKLSELFLTTLNKLAPINFHEDKYVYRYMNYNASHNLFLCVYLF